MLSKNLKYRATKIGTPAGSLTPTSSIHTLGDKEPHEIKITAYEYSPEKCIERGDLSMHECLEYLESPSFTWINVQGTNDPVVVAAIGQHFGLHPLMLEDIMSFGQRSKLDNYGSTLYIVVNMLTYNQEKQSAEDEQVSIILGKNFVISFFESNTTILNPIRERLKNPSSKIRQRGPDYLCYSLIDCIVDSYFLILEKVDEKLESLETELFQNESNDTLQKIQHTKREIILLRKSVWPMREVISNMRRLDSPLIDDSTKLYIQDVYDHTIQAIDTIESFRDVSSGMLDIYLSNMTQRMNEIIKVLTVVSTIFVPLTFIASFYGMNVKMPEIMYDATYPAIIVIMIFTTIWMIYYFRRKKWM